MQMIGRPSSVYRAASLAVAELSTKAKRRLQALEVWQSTGQRALAREVFGLSQATRSRWRSRFDPKDDVARAPGELVAVATLDVRPRPGLILKPCMARDVIARWDGVEVYRRATAPAAVSDPSAPRSMGMWRGPTDPHRGVLGGLRRGL